MESAEIKKTALNFLNEPNRLTAVIGSCPADGDTHVATVYYYVDNNFNFYFLTATNTQKYRNLLENPNAALVVGFGPEYTTIQGQGTAILLEKSSDEESEAIAHIKKRLQDHNDETWPIFQLEAYEGESIAVFKLTAEKLQLLNLENSSGLAATTENVLQIL
jgi:nitroimidazol reductase NimA-like FMN-containing flavoprotein (pyridoxamine 5'-phosphate oxidase superfamily)